MPAEPATAVRTGPDSPGHGRAQRPFTSTSHATRLTARHAAGHHHEAGAVSHDHESHEIELLEYEWPDLPPLPSIKDAITRSRVSHGISYLLPVDKGCNSINNRFRTDLRAMFQEPYASDDLQYDDSRVRLSSKVHFLSNTGDTKWTSKHLASVPVSLNAESEKMRRLYAHSAPSGGSASSRMGLDQRKLRTRSTLYLPIKAAVPPELVKLRKEVEAIIRSVKEDDEEFVEGQTTDVSHATVTSSSPQLQEALNPDPHHPNHHYHHHHQQQQQKQHHHHPHHQQQHPQQHSASVADSSLKHRPVVPAGPRHAPHPPLGRRPSQCQQKHSERSVAAPGGQCPVTGNAGRVDGGVTSLAPQVSTVGLETGHVSQERFETYEELKRARPPRPQIPDSLRSQHLDQQRSQEIWEWLHYGEELDDFDYFLSVCG